MKDKPMFNDWFSDIFQKSSKHFESNGDAIAASRRSALFGVLAILILLIESVANWNGLNIVGRPLKPGEEINWDLESYILFVSVITMIVGFLVYRLYIGKAWIAGIVLVILQLLTIYYFAMDDLFPLLREEDAGRRRFVGAFILLVQIGILFEFVNGTRASWFLRWNKVQ